MILDASALLAFLLAEPGKDRVAEALIEGAVMTTVNFAEVVNEICAARREGPRSDVAGTDSADIGRGG